MAGHGDRKGWLPSGVRSSDGEREMWVSNDEGLYDLWQQSGQAMQAFVRGHRGEIDAVIQAVTSGDQPAHYLKYGPQGGA